MGLTSYFRLTELLAKDATADDPGRVINVSSVAAANTVADASALADKGNGLWSCAFLSFSVDLSFDLTPTHTDNTSKAAVNHLTSLMASTLAPRKIWYVSLYMYFPLYAIETLNERYESVNAVMPG